MMDERVELVLNKIGIFTKNCDNNTLFKDIVRDSLDFVSFFIECSSPLK